MVKVNPTFAQMNVKLALICYEDGLGRLALAKKLVIWNQLVCELSINLGDAFVEILTLFYTSAPKRLKECSESWVSFFALCD